MEEIVIFLLAMLLLGSFIYIKYLKRDIEDKEMTIELNNKKIVNLAMKLTLAQNINYMNSRKSNSNPQILETVKYAMKKAHPDNGGNAEDFNKFRDLYSKLKKGDFK